MEIYYTLKFQQFWL